MAEKDINVDRDKNASDSDLVTAAMDTLDVVQEISDLLNTGLDRKTLSICVQLCEAGVNPEALAFVIQELKRETQVAKID